MRESNSRPYCDERMQVITHHYLRSEENVHIVDVLRGGVRAARHDEDAAAHAQPGRGLPAHLKRITTVKLWSIKLQFKIIGNLKQTRIWQ